MSKRNVFAFLGIVGFVPATSGCQRVRSVFRGEHAHHADAAHEHADHGTRGEVGEIVARPRVADGGRVPLFDGMGSHKRKVTTNSRMGQKYFDQGLVWTFAFNHDEAIRSYTEATRHDPNCAMAWWGIALCHGPHINNPAMTPERSKAAWEALQKAQALKGTANATERQLIDALAARYADPAPSDRIPLDKAYAEAMAEVWKSNPKDADIGVLYAESMMDLRPWDLWTQDGKPQPGTDEVLAALDAVAKLDINHPGLNHLYIHAVEASPNPERAQPSADRLRNLVPASGHMVHMPSHIDVLMGRWGQASKQNERAIKIDRGYRRISPKQEFYRMYMAHNHQMLTFSAMMEGRGNAAIAAAREMIAEVPPGFAEKNPFMDGMMGSPYDALKRFGRWDEILKEPQPASYLPITTAMWRMHRAIAYAAKGQTKEADAEREAFRDAVKKVPADAMFAINKAHDVFAVAEHFVNGEIEYRRGNVDEAVTELNKGIELEDKLRYMEPPEWIQPTRHTLGAILVDAGRYDEAEKVYREDLKDWPENGWSLFGLAKCLKAKGATAEADGIEKRFKSVWANADVQIGSSCLCVKGRG